MLEVYERLGTGVAGVIHERLILDHEKRQKGRFRAMTAHGTVLRIFLERGQALAVGEVLRSQCGKNILVEGAGEKVAIGTTDDWEEFSRACYHLGNRHVKVQVGDRWLRMKPDHVLEAMLTGLGLSVRYDEAVFDPENGAYAKGSRSSHDHSDSHGHTHSDEHDTPHAHHTH